MEATLHQKLDQMGLFNSAAFLLFHQPVEMPDPDAVVSAWKDAGGDDAAGAPLEFNDKDADGSLNFSIGNTKISVGEAAGYPPLAEFDMAFGMFKRRGDEATKIITAATENRSLMFNLVGMVGEDLMDAPSDEAPPEQLAEYQMSKNQWRRDAQEAMLYLVAAFTKLTNAAFMFRPQAAEILPAEAVVAMCTPDAPRNVRSRLVVSVWPTPVDGGGPLIARSCGMADIIGHEIEVRGPATGRDSLEELITCVQDLCAYLYDSGAVLAPGHTLGGHPEPDHPENWKAQKIIKPGALLRGDDEQALLVTRADVDADSLSDTGSFSAEALKDREMVACSLFYNGRARVNPKKIMAAWDKLNPNRAGALKVMPASDGMEFPVELDGVKGKLFKVRDTAFNPAAFQPLTDDARLTEEMSQLKASVGVFLEVPLPPVEGPAAKPSAFRKTLHGYAELARLAAALDFASQGKGSFIKAGQATCLATPGGQMILIDTLRQWAETPNAPYGIMAVMSFATVTPLEYEGQISIGLFGLGPITGFDMIMPAPAGMSQNDMPEFLGRPYMLGELIQDDAEELTPESTSLVLPMSGVSVSLTITDHLMPNFAQNGVKLYVFTPEP